MRRIAVVTATRAEYGLLSPVIRQLRAKESEAFIVDLIVTGTHLSAAYGMTIDEIKSDNIRIDRTVDIPVSNNSECDITNNQAAILQKFAKLFSDTHYDGLLILGDRYEMLAIAIAASNMHIPVFHMCGGDVTEGAMDEWIRHSISKMSYLHFVSNEDSRRRVIQLGEAPERVFNVGSTSIDNILAVADMDLNEVMNSIGLDTESYAVGTYHPVTMNENSARDLIENFINAISCYPDIDFIITKSNADKDGELINKLLSEADEKYPNIYVYASLGVKRYLTLMKHSQFVIGNSSSGIIETPSFGVPTVNIGDRQKGRLRADNIIDCEDDAASIKTAIDKAMTSEYRVACSKVVSPYGDGKSASKIADKIYEVLQDQTIDLKKTFYDVALKEQ